MQMPLLALLQPQRSAVVVTTPAAITRIDLGDGRAVAVRRILQSDIKNWA